MFTSETRVASRTGLLAAEAGGEVILLDPASGLYFSFEGVGSEIWRRLGSPISLLSLCDALSEEYDASPEDIRMQTIDFLSDMLEKRLIIAL
ncbi:MAG: PqqD family protein [Pseudomonadota bacterium]